MSPTTYGRKLAAATLALLAGAEPASALISSNTIAVSVGFEGE